MSNHPLVSVCMLCYNHEEYVAQAIQSVLDQTYHNWELVITDNASTDGSRKIIENFARKDSRIKLCFLDFNSFPSGGINNSIKLSSGEYIATLSGDDYFVPNKLKRQVDFMLENNLSICFTWVNVVDDSGNELIGHWANGVFNRNFDNQIDLLKIFITQGNTLCAVTPIISREVHAVVGLYDNRLIQAQDFDFWLRVIKKYPIVVLNEKLTCYRVRNDNNNLSSLVNINGAIRYRTECIWFVQHICDFEASIVSDALGVDCDNYTKYKELYNYYQVNNFTNYATAILLALYNKLGFNFDFPSPLYSVFFDIYSNFDMFNINNINGAVVQVFFDTGFGFNNLELEQSPALVGNHIYKFNLSKYKNITRIRFDLFNGLAKIKILAAKLILHDKSIDLDVLHCNANGGNEDVWYDYAQFLFEIPQGCCEQVAVVEFYVDIIPYNKLEIFQQLNKLQHELQSVYRSKSWQITKPFRWLKSFLSN